ncbi:MAG: hypothetical protein VYC34_10350 [Planctomycetota bacterium]|nr:hypothetical protein [Planctomycetota bacterium]
MSAGGVSAVRHGVIALSLGLCGVTAGVVALGLILSISAGGSVDGAAPGVAELFAGRGGLLVKTVGVAALIGALAAALAFPAAWSMRRLPIAWCAIMLAPLILPSHLVYAAWGLLRAPGTWLGSVIAADAPTLAPIASFTQAVLGLALWAWPIAALVMAAWARSIGSDSMDALRQAAPGRFALARTTLRMMLGGMAASAGVVALLMLGSAVPLHLSQVETYSIVVWRELAETGGAASVWLSAAPLVLFGVLGGWLLGGRALRADAQEATFIRRDRGVHSGWIAGAWIIWGVSTLAPLALLATSVKDGEAWQRVWPMQREALAATAETALGVGAIALFVGVGAAMAFSRGARGFTHGGERLALRVWLMLALVPGVLIGGAVARVGTSGAADWLLDTRAGVIVSHAARFGCVAALAGWWLAGMEPRALVDARRIAGPETVRAWLATSGRMQGFGLLGAAAVAALLSAHEIEATVMVAPPGRDNLARRLLDQLHYLRMDDLCAAGSILMGAGLLLAAGAALLAGRSASLMRMARPGGGAAAVLLCAALIGCGDDAGRAEAPINVERTIGEVGRSPGQFVYPRALDVAADGLWVIDKTGRIQRVSAQGDFEQSIALPSVDSGFPVGMHVGPDGLLYIADTHEHRILVVDPNAEGLAQYAASFGLYGAGEGEFYYPTDVAIAPGADGATPERIYVSEYGGNDRVSVFDGEHRFLFSFGSPDAAPESRFNRPQSLLYDESRGELIIADACHHRIGRFTLDGEPIAWIGREDRTPGVELGEFHFPYGLALLEDGTLLVAEFGNNRVQRVDLDAGVGLATYGVAGRGQGELAYPWAVAARGGEAFVLDSGNNRIIAFEPGRAPASAPREAREEHAAR